MFDVACGECELVDFLLTRFDPIDLKTKIRFDPSAQVDEQLAPSKEEPEAASLVPDRQPPERVPLQLDLKMPPPPGSPTPAVDPADGFRPAAGVAHADGQDQLELPQEDQPEQAADPLPGSQDWLALYHQRFREAAQRYQQELEPTKNQEDETK